MGNIVNLFPHQPWPVLKKKGVQNLRRSLWTKWTARRGTKLRRCRFRTHANRVRFVLRHFLIINVRKTKKLTVELAVPLRPAKRLRDEERDLEADSSDAPAAKRRALHQE